MYACIYIPLNPFILEDQYRYFQTVQIKMRRLHTGRLILICSVCHPVIHFWLKTLFATMDVSKSEIEESILDTQGYKGQLCWYIACCILFRYVRRKSWHNSEQNVWSYFRRNILNGNKRYQMVGRRPSPLGHDAEARTAEWSLLLAREWVRNKRTPAKHLHAI